MNAYSVAYHLGGEPTAMHPTPVLLLARAAILAASTLMAFSACRPSLPESADATQERWSHVTEVAATPELCRQSSELLDLANAQADRAMESMDPDHPLRGEDRTRAHYAELPSELQEAIGSLTRWAQSEDASGFWEWDFEADRSYLSLRLLGRAIARMVDPPPGADDALVTLIDRMATCGMIVEIVISAVLIEEAVASGRESLIDALRDVGLSHTHFAHAAIRDRHGTTMWLLATTEASLESGEEELPPRFVRREMQFVTWWGSLGAARLATASTSEDIRAALERRGEEPPDTVLLAISEPNTLPMFERWEAALEALSR